MTKRLADTVTTDEFPILRIHRPSGGRLCFTALAVEDIDTDFASYPEFTEDVVNGLLDSGEYDDSEPDYTCVFTTDRPDVVRAQWDALKAAHPELFEEED